MCVRWVRDVAHSSEFNREQSFYLSSEKDKKKSLLPPEPSASLPYFLSQLLAGIEEGISSAKASRQAVAQTGKRAAS